MTRTRDALGRQLLLAALEMKGVSFRRVFDFEYKGRLANSDARAKHEEESDQKRVLGITKHQQMPLISEDPLQIKFEESNQEKVGIIKKCYVTNVKYKL